jgi:hypothetical protein
VADRIAGASTVAIQRFVLSILEFDKKGTSLPVNAMC